MNLKKSVLDWNGRSKDQIEIIYKKFSVDPEFTLRLIELCQSEDTEIGATPLLKKHIETGNSLPVEFYSLLHKPISWEARLHLLQFIPYMGIPGSRKEEAEGFIRICLAYKNKFVRARA